MTREKTIGLEEERRCLKCDSLQTYVLKNGTRVCRVCGFRQNPDDDFSQEVPSEMLEDK